ncbi:hypothetical protein M758_4G241600 [Ceratodon purpureus]|nr:hypothetical protein M758_4G241600 [Ceratodon purpureus]
MALDWHRPAGKSIRDGTLRSLARKGLDILDIAGVSIVGEYNHSSRHLIDGVIRNHVEETLGSAKYEDICKRHTVLNNIHYCQSGLSFVDGFHNPHKIIPVPGSSDLGDAVARPAIINHDYLVLEVGYGYDGEKLFVRAEKMGQPPEKAGILLTVDPNYEETESTVRLFTIRCFGREIGRLPEILAILADHNPEYSLRDQNCWQYTRWTARRLIQRCQQQQREGELSDEELRLLQIEEDSIERRIASTHLKRIVRKGKQGLKSLWKAWGSSGQGQASMELSPVHGPNTWALFHQSV